MGSSNGTIKLKNVTQQQIEQFYEFLQGELPPTLNMKIHPKLTSSMAFKIIYYLQEVLEVFPDKYERCKTCGCIFDSESEGDIHLHCDSCRRD